MITLRETAYSLYGAWRLARFDASGAGYFDSSLEGFWRSFYAAAVVAPLYFVLIYADLSFGQTGDSTARFVAIRLITYVIGWVMFPLVMLGIARTLDREKRFLGYIVAYNWTAVVQYALFTPVAVFMAGDPLIANPAGILGLIVMGYMLVYTWFVAKTALDIPNQTAVMIVVADVVLTIILNIVSEGMIQRGSAAGME